MRTIQQQRAEALTVTHALPHPNKYSPLAFANVAAVLSLVSNDLFELTNCAWVVAVAMDRGRLMPVSILGHPPALKETMAELEFMVSCASGWSVEGEVHTRSADLCFPVIVSGRTVGAIALGPAGAQSNADLRLISEAAQEITALLANDRLAARVVNHALLVQKARQQLELAHDVQNRLQPSQLPVVAGLDYSGDSRPAGQVGGDFFDFVALPEGDLGVVVGDVSGEGIPAAIVMAGIQISFRGLARDHSRHVAALVKEVNRLVYDVSPPNFYASMFYGEVNPASGRLTYINAGHEPPLVIRERGGTVERLRTGGTVVGLTTRSRYEVGTTFLDPGDLMVAFTDGITEASNAEGVDLRDAGVVEAIRKSTGRRATDIVEAILDSVDRFTGGAATDDRTAVVLRMTEPAMEWLPEAEEAMALAVA